MNQHYDVIIVGSGIGALATASFLAQQKNRRVLILEKHFKAGGFTHIFKRKQKYLWDVGIHYLGDLQPGSLFHKVFDKVTGGDVKFHKMPHVFEKFVYPDFTFSVKSSLEEYRGDLIAMFPEEKKGIIHYFEDVKAASEWFSRHVGFSLLPGWLESIASLVNLPGNHLALATTDEVLNRYIKNPRLKALLLSQWGDYGLPPEKSAFVIHALIVHHYLHGAWYPVGGSGTIAAAVKKIVESKGGAILLNHTVQEFLNKHGVATGVRALATRENSDEPGSEVIFTADKIISNVGAFNTYCKLLPPEAAPGYADAIRAFSAQHPVTANVTLYLGLKADPRSLGFHGENHWIYSGYDHNEHWQNGSKYVHGGDVTMAYLSFPSLKDPTAEGHTAEIISFAPYEPFARWAAQPWKKRDEEYQRLKQSITEKLLAFVEQRYPGFTALVDYSELSTPITTEYFTSHPQGRIYGLPCVPERFDRKKSPWFSTKTPVKNLYLTGADALSPGIAGAMMSAIITYGEVAGLGALGDLMRSL